MIFPCGRSECIFKAVEKVIKEMKKEVSVLKKIPLEEIEIAKIYYVVASTLAEACKKSFKIKPENCLDVEKYKPFVSLDTFILLSRLKEDELISEDYEKEIFNTLLEMNPEIRKFVENDRKRGLL